MDVSRRRLLSIAAGAGFATCNGRVPAEDGPMTALGDRAHILVRPEAKEPLVQCLVEILGCGCGASAILNAPGLPGPILAFRFPGGV